MKRKQIISVIEKFMLGTMCALGLFIGLKGCVVTVWSSPSDIETYEINGGDGRSMRMVFMPGNETFISYSDPKMESVEVVRTKMKGVYGTHYVGPIWKMGGPVNLLGLRWYSTGEPVDMEIEVVKKYRIGSGDSSFPKESETTKSTVLFADDAVQFSGMWLQLAENDEDNIQALQSLVPVESR